MKKLQLTKLASLLLIGVFFIFSCSSSASEDEIIDNEEAEETIDEEEMPADSYDITSILSKFDNIDAVSYSVSGTTVTFITTDLPNHTSPYWDTSHSLYEDYTGTNPDWNKNPNSIGEQNITFTMTLNPEEATNKTATPMGPIGISRNGIVFFNQYAAGGAALTGEINSFDQWLGHPAGTQYHYHIEPMFLTDSFGKDAFLGLLSDGFPVYGPLENGTTITSADLDVYHGHRSVTADFPDGIYHYHITSDDPYLNGNGFFGSAGTITR
jgi:plastocyanin